jgi:hypothetical protein
MDSQRAVRAEGSKLITAAAIWRPFGVMACSVYFRDAVSRSRAVQFNTSLPDGRLLLTVDEPLGKDFDRHSRCS